MNKNGEQEKASGLYQLDDEDRDFLIAAVNRMPVVGEESWRRTLGLLEKLRKKHAAPEPVYSSAEQVEPVKPRN